MITADPIFDAAAFKALAGATDAQIADLESFRALLADWNHRMNLVGPSAMPNFWSRHVWDSAQLQSFMPDAKIWADVGAGAGFPGIVLAILMKQTAGSTVHLIESMAKRCRFLSHVVDRLDLPAKVHNRRAEEVSLRGVQVVTARACAPMTRLLGFCWPLLKEGASGLFLKGQSLDTEMEEAEKAWRFKATIFPSRSDVSGSIVKIEGLSRA